MSDQIIMLNIYPPNIDSTAITIWIYCNLPKCGVDINLLWHKYFERWQDTKRQIARTECSLSKSYWHGSISNFSHHFEIPHKSGNTYIYRQLYYSMLSERQKRDVSNQWINAIVSFLKSRLYVCQTEISA